MSQTGASTLSPSDNDSSGETLGEYIELEPNEDDLDITEAEDGGLIVTIGEPYDRPMPSDEQEFYRNLAEPADGLPSHLLKHIASDLMRKIDQDKEARAPRDKQYEEGLARTGLGKDAPGGAEFGGASRVVHPMLTEACIDYEARIMKELWPVAGPVREKILGEITEAKAERAKRKVEYMNFQLTMQIKEARPCMETTLTQVPLGGCQYIKQWWDHRLLRPRWQFVPVDRVYLPANAESWYSAERRTIVDPVSNIELKQRIESGLYREIALSSVPDVPDPSKSKTANDKIEGVDQPSMNLDGDRDLYETMALIEVTAEMAGYLEDEEADGIYPYLITLDSRSGEVLAMYRDWEIDDETREPIDHIFEFPFIPWRGAYAIGLPQIAGGLSGAATGALRALLDSAFVANTQGGFILKGSGASAQTRAANPGEFAEIDGGGMETPDIRQKVMQFNTKEPSTTLFQLLGFVVEAGKGVVRTSLDSMDMGDANPNSPVPVGTQLSRVEEGLTVFSAVHGRIHEAFNRLLVGLHRLNRLYLPEDVRVDAAGKELMVRRVDFDGPPDVMPVSDPTIYSDQQRMAQINAIQQRATMAPQLYNLREVEERFLKLIKVPDPDKLLVPEPEPHELNAINENVSMMMGKGVVAFPAQDHMAHIVTLVDCIGSPLFGSNPLIAPKYLPLALDHLVQHLAYLYASTANDLVSGAAGLPASKLMQDNDPAVKAQFDKLLAVASHIVIPRLQSELAQFVPIVQQAMAMMQKLMPPPPMDPAQSALMAAQADTQRRGTADQMNAALKAKQIQSSDQNNQQRNALQSERNQITKQGQDERVSADIARTVLETRTAQQIAAMKVESGQPSRLSDGASLAG